MSSIPSSCPLIFMAWKSALISGVPGDGTRALAALENKLLIGDAPFIFCLMDFGWRENFHQVKAVRQAGRYACGHKLEFHMAVRR